jgi:hypothetical protein
MNIKNNKFADIIKSTSKRKKFVLINLVILLEIISTAIGFIHIKAIAFRVVLMGIFIASIVGEITYIKEVFCIKNKNVKLSYTLPIIIIMETLYSFSIYTLLILLPRIVYQAYKNGVVLVSFDWSVKSVISYIVFNFLFVSEKFIFIPWGKFFSYYFTYSSFSYLWSVLIIILFFNSFASKFVIGYMKYMPNVDSDDIKKYKRYFNRAHSRLIAFTWSIIMYITFKTYKFGLSDNLKQLIRKFIDEIDINAFKLQGEYVTEALLTFIIADTLIEIYRKNINKGLSNNEVDPDYDYTMHEIGKYIKKIRANKTYKRITSKFKYLKYLIAIVFIVVTIGLNLYIY